MNHKNILNRFFIPLLSCITLSFNSGCYIHQFYEAKGTKIENLKLDQPYSNGYRVIIELDNQELNKYFPGKFDSQLKNSVPLTSTGRIYIYPEYEINSKYELKKTMEADFSANGNGLPTVVGMLLELGVNSFLIGFFGSRLQNDSNNKINIDYFNLSLFSIGLFNVIYDITAYKIKEYNTTGKTKITDNGLLLYSGLCDNSAVNFRKLLSETNVLDIQKYDPQKNKIPLKNSLLKFSLNNSPEGVPVSINSEAEHPGILNTNKEDKKSFKINTDESGRFFINKDTSDSILSQCMTLTEIKSDMPEAEKVKMTHPYTKI